MLNHNHNLLLLARTTRVSLRLVSAGQLGASLLIQHPDEGLLVLIDDLHDPGMTLAEAQQQWLQQERVVKDLVSQELELLNVSEEV